jgi:Fe-S-cluster containining protein
MPNSEPFDYERPIVEGVSRIAAETLRAPDALHRLSMLVDQAARFAEQVLDDLRAKEPPPRPVVCRKGCAFCCHGQEVHVSPLEAIRIAIYVAERLPTAAIAALVRRIRDVEAMKERHRREGRGRASFPCPLLEDGACSVYPVRPFVCRGFNSYDARTCELHKIHLVDEAKIEGYAHQQRVAQSALSGLRRAAAEADLGADALDLAPALRIALTEHAAGERWLAGQPVFEPAKARLEPADEPPPVTRH